MVNSMSNRRTAGFTLIELLVVIAIIAILAAILFPVFAKVREKARQTTCASNEKQIGLAIIQYQEDNDEHFPRDWSGNLGFNTTTDPNAAQVHYKWMDAVYPYTKSTAVFTCPDDSSDNGKYVYYGTLAPGATTYHYGTYKINSTNYLGTEAAAHSPAAHNAGNGNDTISAPTVAAVQAPTTTALVLEAADNITGFGSWISWSDKPGQPTGVDTTTSPYNFAGVSERHTGQTNVLFCDGHVKSMKLTNLAKKNSAGYYSYFTMEDDDN